MITISNIVFVRHSHPPSFFRLDVLFMHGLVIPVNLSFIKIYVWIIWKVHLDLS
jgi:hypothetical protein